MSVTPPPEPPKGKMYEIVKAKSQICQSYLKASRLALFCLEEIFPPVIEKSPETIFPEVISAFRQFSFRCDQTALKVTKLNLLGDMDQDEQPEEEILVEKQDWPLNNQKGWMDMIFSAVDETNSGSHDIATAPFYCGPCDCIIKSMSDWVSHTRDDAHFKKSKGMAIKVKACGFCGILFLSTDTHLLEIFESEAHVLLDVIMKTSPIYVSKNKKSYVPKKNDQPRAKRRKNRPLAPGKPAASSTLNSKKEIITHRDFGDVFEGFPIRQSFVCATDCMKFDYTKCSSMIFCYPCHITCDGDDSWMNHFTSKLHMFLTRKSIPTVVAMCKLCCFQLVSPKKIGALYMRYHLTKMHPQSWPSGGMSDMIDTTSLQLSNLPSVDSSASGSDGSSEQSFEDELG